MHRILERQIERYLKKKDFPLEKYGDFLEAVSKSYEDFDEDRDLLNRSFQISSKEFQEQRERLLKAKSDLEAQAANLAKLVEVRTKDLNKRVAELEEAKKALTNLLEDLDVERNKSVALVSDLQKFKLAVDETSDMIIITDPEGIVLYGNKAVEKVTGYKSEEIVGTKSGSLWKTPMPKEYYEKLWDTIKNKKQVFSSEILNRRKSGVVYTAAISISPIVNKSGEIEFFVGIERDITREKEADRAKTEFLSIASHALRTPLTAIDGIISMILDGEYGEVGENLRQPLEDISTSSERLIHLVNDLLSISRIRAGRMKYTMASFNLLPVIEESVRLLQPLAEQKRLTLEAVDLKSVMVQADVDKIKEVLTNLIGNSLKFTEKGGVTLSTVEKAEMMEIHIKDTGIGIDKKDQPRLFGQFQQIESGRGGAIGTGLGLHISKDMAQKMGGDVWLENSELSKGSEFVFSVPKGGSKPALRAMAQIAEEARANPDQRYDVNIHTSKTI